MLASKVINMYLKYMELSRFDFEQCTWIFNIDQDLSITPITRALACLWS